MEISQKLTHWILNPTQPDLIFIGLLVLVYENSQPDPNSSTKFLSYDCKA